MTPRRVATLLFLAAMALRLVHLFAMASGPYFVSPQLDELNFDSQARRIAFGPDLENPGPFARAPLYPYFLAAVYRVFGHDYFVPRLLQSLCGSLGVVLVYLIGRMVFKDGLTPLLAGVLAALYPAWIFFDGELLITALILPLNLLFLYLLLRWRASNGRRFGLLAAAGIACGLSAIGRPNILLLTPFLAVWVLLSAHRAGAHWLRTVTAPVVLAAAVSAVVLPVTMRNLVVSGELVLISHQGGVNFWVGNHIGATGYTAATPRRFEYWDEYRDSVDLFAERQAELETGRDMKASEISRFWARRAWSDVRNSPAWAIAHTFRKLVLFCNAEEIRNNKYLPFAARFSRVTATLLWVLSFGVIAPPALVRVFRRRPTFDQALLLGFLLFYMVSVVAFFVYARYRLPVAPVLILYAAAFAADVRDDFRARRGPSLVFTTGLLIAASILVWGNWYGIRDEMRRMRYEDFWIAGNGYAGSGRYDRAIDMYRRSLELKPDFVDGWQNLGIACLQAGELIAAKHAIGQVLRLEPDHHGALSSAAVLAERGRDTETARRVWNAVLQQDPDYAPALLGLGDLLRREGRCDEARPLLERACEIRPRDHQAATYLALLHHACGETDVAARWLERAMKRNPEAVRQLLIHEGIQPADITGGTR